MRISRSLAALAIIGAITTGISTIFLAAQAVSAQDAMNATAGREINAAQAAKSATPGTAQPEKSGGYGYGYSSKSPTPSRSRTRSSSATASPSPSGTLPETGQHTGSLLAAGLISVMAGFVLVLSVWIWQARARDDRSGAPQRHPL